MTDASRDEKIDRLIAENGPIAYARFWRVIEVIAEQMDGSDRCEVTFSWAMWMRITWASSYKQARSNLEALARHSLINLEATPHQATCSCSKLLEIRARKQPIGRKVSTLEAEADTEVRKVLPKGNTNGSADKLLYVRFDRIWKAYPVKGRIGREAAKAVWRKLKPTDEMVNHWLEAIERQSKSDRWENGWVPAIAKWLSEGRWDDAIDSWKERLKENVEESDDDESRPF